MSRCPEQPEFVLNGILRAMLPGPTLQPCHASAIQVAVAKYMARFNMLVGQVRML